MITNTRFIILGLMALLMTNQGFSQEENETKPEKEQKLSLNLGALSYLTLNSNTIENRFNLKPVLSLNYKKRIEVGVSYLKIARTLNAVPDHPEIKINKDQSYIGAFIKGYFGKAHNYSFQVGYNRIEHTLDEFEFITGYHYPNKPTELSNRPKEFTTYTYKNWLSIAGGYSFKLSSQLYIEPQLAYHFANKEEATYDKNIKNLDDLSAYPDNEYKLVIHDKEKFNEFQINLIITYHIPLIKE